MRIVKLDIDENSILAGVDAVALVEQPAIEEDFMYFNKQIFADSYNDYPKSAVTAAQRGIELNEKNDNKCATQVGKVRAQQLVNGENLTLDTIRRMRSFLIRQRGNYELARERKDYNACGYISFLLWGGETALPWAEKKLRQAGEDFGIENEIVEGIIRLEMFSGVYDTENDALVAATLIGCEGAHQMPDGKWMPCATHQEMDLDVDGLPNYVNEVSGSVESKYEYSFAALDEKQMLMGPLMIPNKLIPRLDEDGNQYYVYFTEDTIRKISYKMMRDKMIDRVNIEHDSNDVVDDAYLVETWLVEDPETDKSVKYGFKPVRGQWMGIYKIDNKNIWDTYIKTGKVRGFSVEGFFESYAMSKTTCRKNGQCVCGLSSNERGLCDGSHLKK